MDKIRDWLIMGTVLMYIGINSLATGPYDNRITTIVAPYIMLPVGIILLIRGLAFIASVKEVSSSEKVALVLCYPLMTMGVMLLVFGWLGSAIRESNVGSLVSNWATLVGGGGLLLLGMFLRKKLD